MTMMARGVIRNMRSIIGAATVLRRSTSNSFLFQNPSLSPPTSHIRPFPTPQTSFSRHLSGSYFLFFYLFDDFELVFLLSLIIHFSPILCCCLSVVYVQEAGLCLYLSYPISFCFCKLNRGKFQ